ncbi:MAG TPA: hypothetical protein VJ546_11500 [Bacillales bacterium]|nr:hypothetical protein [Bacillales bacterium]
MAFLWHDVDNMINFGFDDLIKLIESFNELICFLQSTEYGLSEPIDLLLCFTGNKDTLKRLIEVMTN